LASRYFAYHEKNLQTATEVKFHTLNRLSGYTNKKRKFYKDITRCVENNIKFLESYSFTPHH
jgi:hypothetical protein